MLHFRASRQAARSMLALAGVVALAAPMASAQTPPGVLAVGQVAEPKSLDPHAVTTANDFRIVVNIYDGLVRYADNTLDVEPALAESWDVSADGLDYTFHLREGVTFHDGTPLNSDAIVFNFERMLDENHPYHDTGPFPLSLSFDAIENVTAIDESTVVFHLRAPHTPFLSNLACATGLIVSPASVAQYGKDYGRHPSGTGPYKFKEWQSNSRVVVNRNEAYWDGRPGLETIVFRPLTDASTRVSEMRAGGIDLMVEVPPDDMPSFDGNGFRLYEQAGPHLWFLILNTREGPMADKRVRQAVNYAIDKQNLVENLLQGTAEIAAGPTPPAFAWAYDDALRPYPYDPEMARALISEAGAQGAEITFYAAEGGLGTLDPIAMGTAIQADLAAVGLKVKTETYDWNAFLAQVNPGLEGKADMAEMAWMASDPDTLPYLTLRTDAWPDKGGLNSGYYSNEIVDELLAKARITTSQDERARLYKEMQARVQDDAPWAFIANLKQNAAATDAVEGFKLQPSFFLLLKDVTKG